MSSQNERIVKPRPRAILRLAEPGDDIFEAPHAPRRTEINACVGKRPLYVPAAAPTSVCDPYIDIQSRIYHSVLYMGLGPIYIPLVPTRILSSIYIMPLYTVGNTNLAVYRAIPPRAALVAGSS